MTTSRIPTSVFLFLFFTLIISGLFEYYLQIKQAQWIPYFLSAFSFALISISKKNTTLNRYKNNHTHPIKACLLLFFLVIFISAIYNATPISGWIIGVKTYVLIYLMIFVFIKMNPSELLLIWKYILLLPLIQLPFVIHQVTFIVPIRDPMWAFDAVVGTFGGDPMGGGANSVLMYYCLASLFLSLSLLRAKYISKSLFSILFIVSLIIILAGETKIVVLLIPIGLAFIYIDRFANRPSLLIIYFLATTSIILVVLYSYQMLYWEASLGTTNVFESIEKSVDYIFDPENLNYETGEVGRVAGLNLWWEDSFSAFDSRLIGYGPASSRVAGTLDIGKVAIRFYPFEINSTTAATLLWEVGILGVLAFAGFLLTTVSALAHLLRAKNIDNLSKAIARASAAIAACLLISIIYNRSLVDNAAVGVLFALCASTVWSLRPFGIKLQRQF